MKGKVNFNGFKRFRKVFVITAMIAVLFPWTSAMAAENAQSADAQGDTSPQTITLGFAGDINLSDDWCTMKYMTSNGLDITDCIGSDVIAQTNSYDLFMINNEFTYSTRGSKMKGKAYTFRANLANISMIEALGTDVVLMANNHVYDYGKDAFLDTLDTLSSAGILEVGAGRNISEAMAPVYFDIDGITISYVAASRAEKNIMTPKAGDNSPGILYAYDEAQYLECIKTAKANSDYCVASIHWGTEYSNNADKTQRKLAKEFIDAGADVVIGTHPHVIQGIEYYKDKPIIYSLGNFWFNEKNLYSCLFDVTLEVDSSSLDKKVTLSQVRFTPLKQEGYHTFIQKSSTNRQKCIDFENSISFDATVGSDYIVTNNAS